MFGKLIGALQAACPERYAEEALIVTFHLNIETLASMSDAELQHQLTYEIESRRARRDFFD